MKRIFLISGIATAFLIVILASCNRKDDGMIVGLNQNIHHDDFEYSVTSFLKTTKLDEITDQSAGPDNIYLLVRFKVDNKAMRVGHRWDNSIGFITDENGSRYENNKEDQILLDHSLHFGWKDQYLTPAGTSDSTILVFSIPASVSKPYLMVRGGILMGDVFDGARFRKIKVKLF